MGILLLWVLVFAVMMIWRACQHRMGPLELYLISAAHRRILIERARSYPPAAVKALHDAGGW
jgi:hypothetical protein